jgi:flavin reductase (DIM6/NTAB) family NADH-FMN oxidoreductase RutF
MNPAARRSPRVAVLDPARARPAVLLEALSVSLAPRPLVLVGTFSAEGVPNLAPFSAVFPLSLRPPLLGLVVFPRATGGVKATLRNLEATREFVVSTLDLRLLRKAIRSGLVPRRAPGPPRGLRLMRGVRVRAPRVAGALAQLECRLLEVLRLPGSQASLVVGEVLRIALRPGRPVGHAGTLRSGEYLFSIDGRILRVKDGAWKP